MCGSREWTLHRWCFCSSHTRQVKTELSESLAGGGWWGSVRHGKEPWSLRRKDNPRSVELSVNITQQKWRVLTLNNNSSSTTLKLTLTHLNWEDINVEADEPAWHHQSPYAGILVHELSYCRGFDLHQLTKNLLVGLQSQHVRTVVVYEWRRFRCGGGGVWQAFN